MIPVIIAIRMEAVTRVKSVLKINWSVANDLISFSCSGKISVEKKSLRPP